MFGIRETRQRCRPKQYTGCPVGYDWKMILKDICFLTTFLGDILPWNYPVNRPEPLLAFPLKNSNSPQTRDGETEGECCPANLITEVKERPFKTSRLLLWSKPVLSCKPRRPWRPKFTRLITFLERRQILARFREKGLSWGMSERISQNERLRSISKRHPLS